AGQWKGYLGAVTHTTATHVQVELHSRLKKVMVVKERVHVIGDHYGATENGDGNAGPGAGGFGAPGMARMGGHAHARHGRRHAHAGRRDTHARQRHAHARRLRVSLLVSQI
ncbi:hypothetical protein THAOC_37558, partial [Thalassiosira oceanica]